MASRTRSKSEDNASDKRNIIWNAYDDTIYWGPSSFDRTHVLTIITSTAVLAQFNQLVAERAGRVASLRCDLLQNGDAILDHLGNDIAGVGDESVGQPLDLVGDPNANANGKFSDGTNQNFRFNPAAFASPARGIRRRARNLLGNPGDQQWDAQSSRTSN